MKLIIDIPYSQYRTITAKTQKDVVEPIDYKLLVTAIKDGVSYEETPSMPDREETRGETNE